MSSCVNAVILLLGYLMIATEDHERGFGGETGIRTLGRLPFNGFQDRRIRPLCHLSVTDFIITTIGLQTIFIELELNLESVFLHVVLSKLQLNG